MHILYLGGTGEISYSCVHASLRRGHRVTVFNRGRNDEPLPPEVEVVHGDANDEAALRTLGARGFDSVCQFLAYSVEQAERDVAVFGGRTGQYVFISTASAYQKPQRDYRITERTPLENPHWEYSRKKAAMERTLLDAHAAGKLAVTVVRPSHTHRRRFPGTFVSGDHVAHRMLAGKPVVCHGDGSSLWTLTHSDDFAVAFTGLLGNPKALGEAFHITRDHAHLWTVILNTIAEVLGVRATIVYAASRDLVKRRPQWEGPLLGDKSCSVVFDNAKVSGAVGGWSCAISMEEGLRRTAEHVRARLAAGWSPSAEDEALLDEIVAAHG